MAIALRARLHEPGWLALQRSRHLSQTQQKSTLRLHDHRASPGKLGSQYFDAGIPGGYFPSNHVCRTAWRINQARNRTAGNTLLMGIASNLYINLAVPGWPFSCSTGINVTSARASQLGSCDQALTVSFAVTQFARERFGICYFRGSCMRGYDLI